MLLISLLGCVQGAPPGSPRDSSFAWGFAEPLLRVPLPLEDVRRIIAFEAGLGARWHREWVDFTTLFSAQGVLDEQKAERLDAILSAFAEKGIRVIAVEDGCYPAWMTGLQGSAERRFPLPRQSDPRYRTFLLRYTEAVSLLLKRFPQLSYYQAGNEPNFDRFFYPAAGWFSLEEKVAVYADMLKALSAAKVQQAWPVSIVLGGLGLADEGSADYLERLYRALGARQRDKPWEYFQVLAWHPYIDSAPSAANLLEPQQRLLAVAARFGDADKPLFITEFGFSIGYAGHGNAGQIAGHLERSVAVAFKHLAQLKVLCWFRLLSPAWEQDPFQRGFGQLMLPGGLETASLPPVLRSFSLFAKVAPR